METVDNSKLINAVTYREVLGCEHLALSANPLNGITLNVGISGSLSHLMVVEQGKIKILCWSCVEKSVSMNNR